MGTGTAIHRTGPVTMTATAIDAEGLLLLLNWMSPAFPTGSFAYSHGLETAIAKGVIRDADSLQSWISDLVSHGSGWNDAVLIANLTADNGPEINQLALSLSASAERHLESTALGASFREAASAFVPIGLPEGEIAYPVAVAAAGLAAGIDRSPLLLAYLQSFAAMLVSVAVRLVPIGQRAGLFVLAALVPVLKETAERAGRATLDDLGGASLLADIASMQHEFQKMRIFRT